MALQWGDRKKTRAAAVVGSSSTDECIVRQSHSAPTAAVVHAMRAFGLQSGEVYIVVSSGQLEDTRALLVGIFRMTQVSADDCDRT